MDAATVTLFNTATRQHQSIYSETITIGGNNYTCTESSLINADFNYEAGGALQWIHAAVLVSKLDLATEPARGTAATFKGLTCRVTSVNDLVFNWEISIVQMSD